MNYTDIQQAKEKSQEILKNSDQFILLSNKKENKHITITRFVKEKDKINIAAALINTFINLFPESNPIEQLEIILEIHANISNYEINPQINSAENIH